MADKNNFTLDEIFKTGPTGSLKSAITNNLYGINHRQIRGAVPSNNELYGLTFFVRPQLNMQTENLRASRKFYPLLTSDQMSYARAVRCMLDPRQQYGYDIGNTSIPPLKCPLVDNLNPFMVLLTNELVSFSGGPDLVAPTFTSKKGLYGEEYIQIDGTMHSYGRNQLSTTFRNSIGSPILLLLSTWLWYATLQQEGVLVKYWDMIRANRLDYTSRVYRIILDIDKSTVKHILTFHNVFPTVIPTGQIGDFNVDRPYNDQNKDLTVPFECAGFEIDEPILVKEFNETVQIFNPHMKDSNRENNMIKVHDTLLDLFNNRGYPRINPSTMKLEWWVPLDLFNNKTNLLYQSGIVKLPDEITSEGD